MGKFFKRGTPNEMLDAFKGRISELDGEVESSFVYPDDLEDLENGEYESHVTEPINASVDLTSEDIVDWICEHDLACSDCKRYFKVDDLSKVDSEDLCGWIEDHDQLYEDFKQRFGIVEECITASVDPVTQEVLDYFEKKLGWDVSNKRVRNYADAVAEYIDISREAEPAGYTMDEWYRDTKMNYPEELEEFEASSNCDVSEKSEILGSVLDMDEDARERYLHNLIGTIESKLPESVESIIWDNDDKTLFITVTTAGDVSELEVPFEDLTQSEEKDSKYIIDAMEA